MVIDYWKPTSDPSLPLSSKFLHFGLRTTLSWFETLLLSLLLRVWLVDLFSKEWSKLGLVVVDFLSDELAHIFEFVCDAKFQVFTCLTHT